MNRSDLKPLIVEALESKMGTTSIAFVTKYVWDNYHKRIENEPRMIYTWQYDIRWAAQSLKQDKVIELSKPKKGFWSLVKK